MDKLIDLELKSGKATYVLAHKRPIYVDLAVVASLLQNVVRAMITLC